MPVGPGSLRIGVAGGGVATDDEETAAEAVGRAIASAGAVLYCGGLGGVMTAAARGARAGGGVTVGILPGVEAGEANPFITYPIVTGMDQARNVILVRSCHAIIAVGGEYGTLSEIALARKLGVPVVGLGTWKLNDDRGDPIPQAASPEQAVCLAVSLGQEWAKREGSG